MESNVIIVSTSANEYLYNRSLNTYPFGVDAIKIDGKNGMHGLDSILYTLQYLQKNRINPEWLLLVDEDFFFTNYTSLSDFLSYLSNSGYTIAGVRDGGAINHRKQNPYTVNTFFTVLHYPTIKEIFVKADFIKYRKLGRVKHELSIPPQKYGYDECSIIESYYKFFFYLTSKGAKTYYMSSKGHMDGIANIIFDHKMNKIGVHTWYSRSYNVDPLQTDRINRIIDTIQIGDNPKREYIIIGDRYFKTKQLVARIVNKLRW